MRSLLDRVSKFGLATLMLLATSLLVSCNKSSSGGGPSEGDTIGLGSGEAAVNPSPADQAKDVPIDADLSWSGSPRDDLDYTVYFGAGSLPLEPLNTREEKALALERLEYDTTYFWRVDVSDAFGNVLPGDEWEFRTIVEAAPELEGNPSEVMPKRAGEEIQIEVTTRDPADTVTLVGVEVPSGASFTSRDTDAPAPRSETLSWTPGASNVGLHIVTFRSQDAGGLNAASLRYALSVVDPLSGPLPLDHQDVFRMDGGNPNDLSGWSVVGLGDINGDGYGDVGIGAPNADPQSSFGAGTAYVLLGGADVRQLFPLNLEDLDGNAGFRLISTVAEGAAGFALAGVGDVDADGYSDFMVGAPSKDNDSEEGDAYLVFGSSSFSATIDLTSLGGQVGVRVSGLVDGDLCGWSLSGGGDVDGDGVTDILIGAPDADPADVKRSGETYVLFGGTHLRGSPDINLANLDSSTGLVIHGIAPNDNSATSVAFAGDVNADGFDDILIGAPNADPQNLSSAGEAYLVFGRADIGSLGPLKLENLDASLGVLFEGLTSLDRLGTAVSSAGDTNGDGYADILLGAPFGDAPSGWIDSGETYLVYGGSTIGQGGVFDLAAMNGTNGVTLYGAASIDFSGSCVASAGDVDGNGYADFLIGSSLGLEGQPSEGQAYLIFGQGQLDDDGTFDLAALDDTKGIALEGIDPADNAGISCACLGDIDGDGFSDFGLGAPLADPSPNAGETYVIFGKAADFVASVTRLDPAGDVALAAVGTTGDGSDHHTHSTRMELGWRGGLNPSNTLVERFRTRRGIFNFPDGKKRTDMIRSHWRVQSNREQFSLAEVAITYTAAQIEGLDESQFKVYHSNHPGGPWVALETVSLDPANNRITAITPELGYFTVGQ